MPYSSVESMKNWQQQGVKVGLYTINDPILANQMLDMGADLLETDEWSRMANELRHG